MNKGPNLRGATNLFCENRLFVSLRQLAEMMTSQGIEATRVASFDASCSAGPSRDSRLALLMGIFLMALLLRTPDAQSRTWHVLNDGRGDAPTIQAAVDSAAASDTILVGPGIYDYQLPIIIEQKDSLTVLSEMGPEKTWVRAIILNIANYTSVIGFSFGDYENGIILSWSHHLRVENNIIRNASSGGLYAIVSSEIIIRNNLVYSCLIGLHITDASDDVQVIGNTISHCSQYGVYTDASYITFQNNIISFNGVGVSAFAPFFSCNDVYGNTVNYDLFFGGDPTGTNGNISAPPLFCGSEPQQSGNYYLQSVSPCAAGNHPDGYPCGLIGRNPVACDTTAVDKASWGRIKSLYR